MPDHARGAPVTVEVSLSNTSGRDITVLLEPWGTHHPMANGKRFRLVGIGPPGKVIEIEYGRDFLVAWAEGDDLRLYEGDVEIG